MSTDTPRTGDIVYHTQTGMNHQVGWVDEDELIVGDYPHQRLPLTECRVEQRNDDEYHASALICVSRSRDLPGDALRAAAERATALQPSAPPRLSGESESAEGAR